MVLSAFMSSAKPNLDRCSLLHTWHVIKYRTLKQLPLGNPSEGLPKAQQTQELNFVTAQTATKKVSTSQSLTKHFYQTPNFKRDKQGL